MFRSYYHKKISHFLDDSADNVFGELSRNHHFALDIEQKNAWLTQINDLKAGLINVADGEIFFEFSIPRMGKRVDVILLIQNVVFVLEYKAGSKTHDKCAIDQALDYALDLKNFHEGSHNKPVIPILIATNSEEAPFGIRFFDDNVSEVIKSNGKNIALIIETALSAEQSATPGGAKYYVLSDAPQQPLERDWNKTGYKPTPTIVEAAQALYKGHKEVQSLEFARTG